MKNVYLRILDLIEKALKVYLNAFFALFTLSHTPCRTPCGIRTQDVSLPLSFYVHIFFF
jgi:hypothetical protein